MAPRRIRQRPEEVAHIAVGRFLDVSLPSDAHWWHTPNGGKRTKVEAGKFKAMGVRAGFPDIAVLYRGRLYVAEMKAPGRGASDAQDDEAAMLVSCGATYMGIWQTIEDCYIGCLSAHLPMRAKPFGLGTVRATSAGSRRAA